MEAELTAVDDTHFIFKEDGRTINMKLLSSSQAESEPYSDEYGAKKWVILLGYHGAEPALNTYVADAVSGTELSQYALHLRRDYITSNDYHMDSAEWFKRRE
ncbi:MAG: hypothetical protein IJH37_09390 [Clostridia bacterium]|nr:hypothetical protein [Clostridia bacterium]